MAFSIPQNLAQTIADHISEQIIRMELPPGERILEAKIAEDLNVSRSPVREALRILERYRLVELIPRRGARVTEMDSRHLQCLFEVMVELVGLIARLCCKRRTPAQLNQLFEFKEKARDLADKRDQAGFFDTIFQYASVCLQAANNPLLKESVLDLLPSFRRAYYQGMSQGAYKFQSTLDLMEQFTRYMADQNVRQAEKIVREHAAREMKHALNIHFAVAKPESRLASDFAGNPYPAGP